MYLAIIILPLLGSIVSGLFGRKVGVSGAQLITCLSVIVTTILALTSFTEAGLNSISVTVPVLRWLDSESLDVLWSFNFDSLTVSMLIPVLIISCLVHIYSIGYMSHDPHNQRFFSYLSLFTFMMIILVTADNYLFMFVGWEGVGVCSYLLVSFWFTRIAANQSSLSAFLTNRVGDCFLTLGMFGMLWTFGNLDYSTVFSLAPFINVNTVTIVGICLLIGAMAKSSQIGLHVWLPLAMEGPTPVSALIHAATMVTAGVYLLMRSSPLIEYSATVLIACLWIGSITTVFSSLIGLFQQDIKKVIAYSTMSQLGMMVIAVGLSSYTIALFHLVNHAFYKGLLFLAAGAVIHAVNDHQDFRKYGGLLWFLPLTYTVMLIASLSLVAFPFMAGFYSKDLILESAFGQYQYSSIAVYFTATLGAVFTTLYSAKVLYLTFFTSPNGPRANYNNAHEGEIYMSLPLMILALFSIFFGYMTKDIFIGLASGFFLDNSLFIHPVHEIMLNTEFAVPSVFKLLPLIFTISFSVMTLVLSEVWPRWLIYFKYTRFGYNIFSFFNLRFLVEILYNRFLTIFILRLAGQTTKILDKGSIELIGPSGLERGLLKLSRNLSSLDTGVITSYALYIVIALILYMLIPYLTIRDASVVMLLMYALYIISTHREMSNNKSILFNAKQIEQSGLLPFTKLLQAWPIFLFVIFTWLHYRIPVRFSFELLGISDYFYIYNSLVSAALVMVVYGLKNENFNYVRVATIVLAGSVITLLGTCLNIHLADLALALYIALQPLHLVEVSEGIISEKPFKVGTSGAAGGLSSAMVPSGQVGGSGRGGGSGSVSGSGSAEAPAGRGGGSGPRWGWVTSAAGEIDTPSDSSDSSELPEDQRPVTNESTNVCGENEYTYSDVADDLNDKWKQIDKYRYKFITSYGVHNQRPDYQKRVIFFILANNHTSTNNKGCEEFRKAFTERNKILWGKVRVNKKFIDDLRSYNKYDKDNNDNHNNNNNNNNMDID